MSGLEEMYEHHVTEEQAKQAKEVEATFAAILALRDEIRIEDARNRDSAGIRPKLLGSDEEQTRKAVIYSSMLLSLIHEFTPRLTLVEMHQVKDLLYGLTKNLLHRQHPLDLGGPPYLTPAIKAAARILCDTPTDEGKQQAHCLEIVAAFAKRMPSEREKRSPTLWVFRDQLTLECDERFETLPLEFISEKLDEMVGENVKGRGKLRVVGVAAHLAVKVGAWRFDELATDFKANVDLARDQLAQAQKNARKRKQTEMIKYLERDAAGQTDFIERCETWAKENGRELDPQHWRLKAARESLATANEQLTILREKKRRK